MKRIKVILMCLTAVAMPVLFTSPAGAFAAHLAQGSWFGRAVPIGPCAPGSPGCPLPPELFMVLNIYQDGNFIGNDSLVFGAQHTTAHGQWFPTSRNQIWANYVVLAGAPAFVAPKQPDGSTPVSTPFLGAFRMRWLANVTDVNNMEGFVNVYFFPFNDPAKGVANIDPNTWVPIPDPLADLGPLITDQNLNQCNPLQGCFGIFRFKIRRVSVP